MQAISYSEVKSLLKYATPEEQAFLLSCVERDPVVWRPLPGPQSDAYHSIADVVGYGGAAGGGKTDLAVGKALTKHRKIGIFRREGTELTAIEDRIREIIGNDKGYNGQKKIWRTPVPGVQQIEFGSTPNAGDEKKHQGRPKDLLVLDEAANFLESQARFLMGWVRTISTGQLCQTLMCFNPPTTIEGRWIVAFFAPWIDKNYVGKRALPGELRYFAMIDGKECEVDTHEQFEHKGELITPQSRTFIPSRVSDNPYLYGTGYMTQLQALPEPLRSQMLYGDFEAGMTDDPWQVIPTEWVDIAMKRWKKFDSKPRMDSVGVDVARGGADNTIIARRHGMWFDEPLAYPGTATPDGPMVSGLVIAATRDRAPIHIDVIGVGASPYDFLVQAGQQTIGVNVGTATKEADKSGLLSFSNLRSYQWWKMREALDPDANNGIALPPSPELRRDLCTPKWELRGKTIHVWTREQIIAELGRSADWASAYLNALMDTPRIVDLPGAHLRRLERQHGHDPYKVLDHQPAGHDPYAKLR